MIQRLSPNLSIHIPYKSILKSQRYMLRRLNDSLSTDHNFIGQFKLSSRMTTILLSYIFSLMDKGNKNKIYFICESKARCREVKEIAEKLKDYYKRNEVYFNQLNMKTPSQQQMSSRQQFKLQKSEIVIMQRFFHLELQLLKDYPNDKYLSILSINEYFQQLIEQKLHSNTKQHYPKHISNINKANYLFIETVAFDQIIENAISGWLNEIVIRRAYIEYKKLTRHYHEREDKKKLMQGRQVSGLGHSTHTHNNHSQLFGTFHNFSNRDRLLEASEIEKKIGDYYLQKKKALLKQADKKVQKNKQDNQTISEEVKLGFQEEAYIVLDMVGYLINWLQSYQVQTRQSAKSGKEENMTEEYSSSEFLTMMKKKLLLNQETIKRMYPVLKKLFQLYPPVVQVNVPQNIEKQQAKAQVKQTKPLSSRHILHLTKFFYDLIRFDQLFNQKYNQCIEVIRSSYKEREKSSFFQIKFKCLNQPLLTEIMLEYNERFIVMMNNGIPFEFYTTVFKPKLLLKNQAELKRIYSLKIQEQVDYECTTLSQTQGQTFYESQRFKFCFQSPSDTHIKVHSNIYGLNVTITPSQQNLSIPQLTHSKQQQQHDSLIIKAYGVLLYDISEVISDGLIIYFPSISILNKFKKEWIEKQDIYKRINSIKKIFEETEYEDQNQEVVEEYKKVCDIGRGGIFFVTANGGMAKYVAFHGHYSRCVMFLGFPKIGQIHRKKETVSTQKDRQEKIKRENYLNLKQSEIQAFYGLKTTAKCLSNCINSTLQPKCVIFADVLYNRKNSKKWFPFMKQGNLSTLQVIQKLKKYYQNCQKQYQQRLNQQMIKNNLGGQTNINSSRSKPISLNSSNSIYR